MAKAAKEAPPVESYWRRTRRPVYSLAFVLPMILFYELAIIVVNRQVVATHGYAVRNACDKFILRLMGGIFSTLGWREFFMSGVLVATCLVGWQVLSRRSWELKLGTLFGMLCESILLAVVVPVVVVNLVEPMLSATIENGSVSFFQSGMFARIVMSFGAGVYEEFIFRLLLIGLFALVVHGVTGTGWTVGALAGIVLSAILFGAAHHLGELGEVFTWPVFIFRVCSGVFFGLVFYFRGFGVAAGTHALYNVVYFVWFA